MTLNRDSVAEEKLLKFQFGIVFVLTFPLTFLAFPPLLWMATGGNPEAQFWPWLRDSYMSALYPAIAIFSRALLLSLVSLSAVFLVLRYLRYHRLVFILGCSLAIFLAAFVAVYSSDLHNGENSLIPNPTTFSLALSTLSAICAALLATIVVILGIEDDELSD